MHIVNTRVRADALQDALHDGLVINLVCFFSAGASPASASIASFGCRPFGVQCFASLMCWWTTLAEPSEMDSLAVRAHIGHCCASVGLLAVLHFLCIRDELDLDFSILPWHSMVAVLLGPRIAWSASVPPIPPLRRICLCRPRNVTEHMRSRLA